MVGPLTCLSVNGAPVWHGFVRRVSGVLRLGKGYCPEASFDGCLLVTPLPLLSKNS